jgi:N-acetylmuramoyl-L-alanine amidase
MIPINKYSRPGVKRHATLAIVVHWPQWSTVSAKKLHDYFGQIASEARYASTQYICGLEGEIVQVMPEDELAYHCGSDRIDPASKMVYTDRAREIFNNYASTRSSPNWVTLGIEVCHYGLTGEMHDVTINALREWLIEKCKKYNLGADKILRHYDVVGWKDCPRYWVKHEDEWKQLLESVQEAINGNR